MSRGGDALALREAAAAGLALPGAGRIVSVPRPDPESADGYLRMTAHILLQAQRTGLRTIGVFSATAGEGKTTAALNLAVCLGRTRGREGRVLLVDADAGRRTLTHLLCGAAADDDASGRRHPMLVATTFEGVDLMTAPPGRDALALHSPAAWRAALAELGTRYAQVVVDCPSLLDRAEGMVLRECVDEVVLVVRSGAISRGAVEQALRTLGRRVLGVILNGAEPPRRGRARFR